MFVKRLKPEIQEELLVADVHGLGQIMDWAQRIVSPIRGDFKPSESFSTRPILLNENNSSECHAVDRGPWVRLEHRLTKAELQEQRKHGLCYHWDEKFVLGHKCKREFNILVVRERELEREGAEEDMTETEEYPASISERVQISLSSLMGLDTLGTMKSKGAVLGKEVIVLIDCCATHTFISWDLVKRFRILVVDNTDFGVETGTEELV